MKMHVARIGAVIAMFSLATSACGNGHSDNADIDVDLRLTGEASAEDVGLPTYPGSTPYEEADGSDSAANLGLSTPLFGIKVVAMSLETSDKPERVATFYRRALAKYGTVLDCSDASDTGKDSQLSGSDDEELVCDSNESGTHDIVYKVGTEKNQRIVAIKPHRQGTRFDLVHLDIRGESKQ